MKILKFIFMHFLNTPINEFAVKLPKLKTRKIRSIGLGENYTHENKPIHILLMKRGNKIESLYETQKW